MWTTKDGYGAAPPVRPGAVQIERTVRRLRAVER
jgi:hypothetical protein